MDEEEVEDDGDSSSSGGPHHSLHRGRASHASGELHSRARICLTPYRPDRKENASSPSLVT